LATTSGSYFCGSKFDIFLFCACLLQTGFKKNSRELQYLENQYFRLNYTAMR
jgi:hypothetical protein